MPKVKISEYSTTNADNTDIEGINIAEGCAPSGINNAIRELMVHLKEFQTGASGDGFTFAGGVLISGTTNTISGNVVMSGNLNSSGTNTFSGATVISNTLSGVTQLNVDNLRLDGNTLSSTDTNGNITVAPNGNGSVVVSSAGTSDALRITQTGTGNALLVEDSANPDATPFVVGAGGEVRVGLSTDIPVGATVGRSIQNFSGTGATGFAAGASFVRGTADTGGPVVALGKTRSTSSGINTIVNSGDSLGAIRWAGDDGVNLQSYGAEISAWVDGTPGSSDMPGRLIFSTTADGASSPTERMRIDNQGRVGIGSTTLTGYALRVATSTTDSTSPVSVGATATVQSNATGFPMGFYSVLQTQATAFTATSFAHYRSVQGTIGAGSTVTNQYGFYSDSTLTGATNNYGFYSNIASGTGRWNFYAAGTADNYFGGEILQGSPNTLTFASPAGTLTPTVQAIAPASSLTQGIASTTHVTSANGPNIVLAKSRGASATSPTIVSSGDVLGNVVFDGYDGAVYLMGAAISGAVDGTPGTNDMPGRLVFSTTADGASSPTERMRITSSGNVGIGTTSPGSALDVKGTIRLSGSTSGYVGLAPAAAAGSTTYTLPSADGSSGQVLSTNGSGTLSWTTAGGSSQWTTSGSDIYYTTGKVGVGVSTFTSGGGKLQVSDGITFPATQSASSNANTLDDYEEGTWTPTQGNFDTWTSPTFTATYTKVGRIVTLCLSQIGGTIGWSAQDYIGGLPFTPSVDSVGYAGDNNPGSDNGYVLAYTNGLLYFQKANASETTLVLTVTYFV